MAEPTELRSFTGTAGDTQVTLTWLPPATPGGALTEIVIEVEESLSGDAVSTDNLASTDTTHVVTGLTNGVDYTFTGYAVNADGEGASAFVRCIPVGPTAPTGGPTRRQRAWTRIRSTSKKDIFIILLCLGLLACFVYHNREKIGQIWQQIFAAKTPDAPAKVDTKTEAPTTAPADLKTVEKMISDRIAEEKENFNSEIVTVPISQRENYSTEGWTTIYGFHNFNLSLRRVDRTKGTVFSTFAKDKALVFEYSEPEAKGRISKRLETDRGYLAHADGMISHAKDGTPNGDKITFTINSFAPMTVGGFEKVIGKISYQVTDEVTGKLMGTTKHGITADWFMLSDHELTQVEIEKIQKAAMLPSIRNTRPTTGTGTPTTTGAWEPIKQTFGSPDGKHFRVYMWIGRMDVPTPAWASSAKVRVNAPNDRDIEYVDENGKTQTVSGITALETNPSPIPMYEEQYLNFHKALAGGKPWSKFPPRSGK